MQQFEHGGNIHKAIRERKGGGTVLDFSANINPLGPPEWLRPLLASHLEDLNHYPDPEYADFVAAISNHTRLNPEQLVVVNGTTELLSLLPQLLPCRRAVVPVPSYVDYQRSVNLSGLEFIPYYLLEEEHFALDTQKLSQVLQPGDLTIIASPNNPTGNKIAPDELLALAQEHGDVFFLFDEAFLDFLDDAESLAGKAPNIITMNSMTKFYACPGLRLGYGSMAVELATKVRKALPPWSVNTFAQLVGTKALADHNYQVLSRRTCRQLREHLQEELGRFSWLQTYPGEANYLLLKVLDPRGAGQLAEHCRQQNILIRRCSNYLGLNDSFCRIAVRSEAENRRLLQVFNEFAPSKMQLPSLKREGKKIHQLMFQGTCSDAGKSILTAALCRVLAQDGVKVAPFKAQNMSLNSFVTLQGHEMGRAQVVQAQAARIDPDWRMNPILLKPNSDTGSQVIVGGKPVGNMGVREYNSYKPVAWQTVCSAYQELREEYDAIILEGAGSPGEVNLKADDIVNMKMAAYAEAPVVLVGDIDRGGVYASFVGIMEVLAQWERSLVAGFLVNKFRGDASLLDSAHSYVLDHTRRPVLGVLPYIEDLGLPEEDSVSFKKGLFNTSAKRTDAVEIVLVNLPHISNFTDVEPFLEEPDVCLRVVNRASEVGNPDAIILPGTKNVIYDLRHLQDQHFAGVLATCRERGTEIVGICGGYQMLGREVRDPYHIESGDEVLQAFGFLPLATTMEMEKTLIRKTGIHQPSGMPIWGYEIHHGISSSSGSSLFFFSDGSSCGATDNGGAVWGSYLHGMFDSDDFRRWFINRLRVRRGLPALNGIQAPYMLDKAFDRLADKFRQNVEMEQIYRLLQLG